MTRPTIFFSHSSSDRDPLERLKAAFVAKTGGAIDVFLASDGQSIPLGSNWVATLQQRLETAQLMLVFVTPSSVDSRWIHFEAGFSHAKGTAVVPIGFLGVDLRELGPPLTLLQGFNITGADSLNNLIALANRTFGHDHALAFTRDDYGAIVDVENGLGGGPLAHLLPCLERLRLINHCDVPTVEGRDAEETSLDELEQMRPRLEAVLADAGVGGDVRVERGSCAWRLPGMQVELEVRGRYLDLRIKVEPITVHRVFELVCAIVRAFRGGTLRGQRFAFRLVAGTAAIERESGITARIDADTFGFLPGRGLAIGELEFEVQHWAEATGAPADRVSLIVSPLVERLELGEVADLLDLLLARRVIVPPAAIAARMRG
ncbi:MAG: toll/interleukin-1 receptor domain-containing protein [Planctomycetes bacterium]|nr:toll/interleukin-1 receptor domain-containing protein [Planctomycetota bacterium]